MLGDGKVIRICLAENCGAIYVEPGPNLTYIKPCKKCENSTGFFESLEHFYSYIDLYGIDTDNIQDAWLRKEVCKHYGISE